MKVLIVHAHPESKSFSSSLARQAKETLEAQGEQVVISDLYAMGFNPVSSRENFRSVENADYFKPQLEERHAVKVDGFAPDLKAEMEKLASADLLIFNSPLWWFSIPAILKGWVDRVFAAGFAYGGGQVFEKGIFRGKRAMMCLTTGGPSPMFQQGGAFGEMNQILYPVQHGVFWFCGMRVLPPFVAWSAAHVTDDQRKEYLAGYEKHLKNLDELKPIFG